MDPLFPQSVSFILSWTPGCNWFPCCTILLCIITLYVLSFDFLVLPMSSQQVLFERKAMSSLGRYVYVAASSSINQSQLVLLLHVNFLDRIKGQEISIDLHSSPLVPMLETSDFLFKLQIICIMILGIFWIQLFCFALCAVNIVECTLSLSTVFISI